MTKRWIAGIMATVFVLTTSGCGTLFYSYREDQPTSRHIDPTVMILDCCGLLFGIIPGAVALVLDFNNNTIYYTQSEYKAMTCVEDYDTSKMVAIHLDNMSEESINTALSAEMGCPVEISTMQVIATR